MVPLHRGPTLKKNFELIIPPSLPPGLGRVRRLIPERTPDSTVSSIPFPRPSTPVHSRSPLLVRLLLMFHGSLLCPLSARE
jgi:hypothetical protein